MKYAVSCYSFSRLISRGEITDIECIKKAKELGFDAIELVDGTNFGSDQSQWLPHALELKKAADEAGIEIVTLCVGADLLKGDEEIDTLKKYVDVASAIGIKKMRHDITGGRSGKEYKSYSEVVPVLSERVRKVAEYAETKGVMTMTENHGYYSQDSERIEMLYNAVNHKNFGVLCDLGNFMCADENPVEALARLAPFAIHVHAKDFIYKPFDSADPGDGYFRTRSGNYLRGTIVGHGAVPVKQCLYQLKKHGYDECLVVEFEGLEEVYTAVQIGLNNLKKYWNEL